MPELQHTGANLAEILVEFEGEITRDWIEAIRELSVSHAWGIPEEVVPVWVTTGLRVLRARLINGHWPGQESAARDVPAEFLPEDFDLPLSASLQCLLIVKEVISPYLRTAGFLDPENVLSALRQLDRSLRSLAGSLSSRYARRMDERYLAQAARSQFESDSLQRTTAALLQKLTLDEALEIVCVEAQNLTGATGSAVLLLEEEGWLRVMMSTGTPRPLLDRIQLANSPAQAAVEQGVPVVTGNLREIDQAYHRSPDLESLLVIPLRAEGKVLGVLDLVNKPGGFSGADVHMMGLFANQSAIAIETARLHQRAEQLAVMEERQRLARELHDSVTQSLYSVSLYADALRLALSSGKMAKAGEHLQELRHMAREAMLDMRLLIFELHPPVLESEGLVEAIRTRLEAVEARSGIKTILNVNGGRRLPIEQELELYRIAQEALTNVVKHSRAGEVEVHIRIEAQNFCLEIRDNGIGFNSNTGRHHGGMGIRNIQDRVRQLGGKLVLESSPAAGTRLQVCIGL